MKHPPHTILALILLTLSGCLVGPDYKQPASHLPVNWSVKSPAQTIAIKNRQFERWWTIFNDPTLTRLMARVQAGNLDLRQAQARLREARARRGLAKAGLFPTLNARASGAQTGSSEEAGSGLTSEFYSNKFDASWEVDVFGKLRRGLEAADASLQASGDDLNNVMVSVYAETALNYVEVRSYQARLAVAEANLGAQLDTYQLTVWRYQAGLTTQLDQDQAKVNAETTRALIPTLTSGLAQAQHRLAVLLGLAPGALLPLLTPVQAIPVAPVSVAVGIPADVLRQRPDVRSAERNLAAQTAKIGVATAARYPNFNLTGSIGLESLAYANLYSASAKAFQMAASAALTLFDGGRLRSNVDIQTAIQEQAMAFYEATILQALRDVENALTAFAQEQSRRDTLRVAEQAGRSALALALQQYESGTVDFLRVLDAQRTLFSVQNQLVQSDAEVASNLIRLYKALGGGWPITHPITKPTS
ncbi:MAG: efflux transporter outer membrane subunit [Methylococcales bacterium]|nr:efflux transporter outer membrane subunit [Methylococcales bacterium]